MKRLSLLVLILALAFVALPRGAAQAQAAPLTVNLSAQNNSGQNGTATITDLGNGQIKVMINLSNGSATPQPAHIHDGTCATLNPKPKYPLNNIVNGVSETTLTANIGDLQRNPYAINVHKSAAEVSVYVACGDITSAMMGGGAGGGMAGGTGGTTGGSTGMMQPVTVQLGAQNASGQSGTATLTDMGNNQTKVFIQITGGSGVAQPAHIHEGTCANLNPTPKYPLTNVVNGQSTTVVNAGMSTLIASAHAINVHKSAAEVSVYVSCGNITTMNAGGGTSGGTGGTSGGTGTMQPVTVQLGAQNASGQSGTAMLTDMGNNQTKVVIQITGGSGVAQPAHIHPGTCANLNPTPKYPLTNVVNGQSTTVVNASLSDLMASAYAINIHKSAAEVSVYVSCGDIMAMNMGGGTSGGSTGGTTGGNTGGGYGGGTGGTTGGNTGGTTGSPGMPTTGHSDGLFLLGLAVLALALTGTGLRLARNRG